MTPLYLLFIFVFLLYSCSGLPIGVDLVCRRCGHTITRSTELINVTSIVQKYGYDFPIVGQNYTVSVVDNPAGETFHLLGSKTASLHFSGKSQSDATWFPGMHWTICVCSKCKQHMGWYFQPDTNKIEDEDSEETVKEQKSFVGLVLDYIISADYTDSLTRVP